MTRVDPDQRSLFEVRRWGLPPQDGTLRHARGSYTSRKAADRGVRDLGRRQRQYIEALDRAGDRGLTDHEASDELRVPLSSINGRRNELMDSEHFNPPLVIDSGRSRPTRYGGEATVWQRNPITGGKP